MQIRAATTQADFFRLMRIRRDVFMMDQGVSPQIEMDDRDDTAIHLLVYLDEHTAVAVCRLLKEDTRYIIGRLAVLPAYRHQGIATALLQFIETLPEVKAIGKLSLHAQCHALPLYTSCGYTTVGDHFLEAGIEHVEMEKLL